MERPCSTSAEQCSIQRKWGQATSPNRSQCMQAAIKDAQSMHTRHGWCIQTLNNVAFDWSLSPNWCTQATNNVSQWMHTCHDLCVQALVDIACIQPMSLPRYTHYMFIHVGHQWWCLLLADISRTMCVGNALCWYKIFDVGRTDLCRIQTMLIGHVRR